MQALSKILLIFITIGSVFAQPTLEWARRYNGPANDQDGASALAIDRFGNVYVTGSSIGIGTGSDYCTIKYNSSGDSLWVRRYNVGNYDGGEDIKLDSAGNVYVTGAPATIKYNSTGTQIWATQNNSESKRIAIDNFGFIYTAGSGYDNYVTNKFDNNGNLLWRAIYNNPANNTDRISDMVLDPYGNIIVTGKSWGTGQTYYDYCTIKYNSQGDSLWVRRYNGPGPPNSSGDYAMALASDNSGNIYVTGYSLGTDNNYNILTIKYGSNGDSLWVKRYTGYPTSGAYDIKTDGNGNIFVAGAVTGGYYIILKYDTNGNLLAFATAFGEPLAGENRIVLDVKGNVYEACGRYINSNQSNILMIKYDNNLNTLWEDQFHAGGPNDINGIKDIKIDDLENIYVAGVVPGIQNSLTDYIVLKYSQVIGISKNNTRIPNYFKLYENYPNPFNPTTKIKFDIPENLKNVSLIVKLIIYSPTGKQLQTLMNEKLNPGSFEVNWSSINYPSGIYFCVLKSDNYTQSIKMLLIK